MAPAFRRGDENRPQRWILASSRVNGTAVPGSLSEGAAERSEAEGVSFDERKRSKISEFICAGGKSLAWRNHRGTLPQSRPLGVPAPSGREPGAVAGGAFHSTGYSLKSGVTGDFHRPYEGSDFFTFHRSSGYSLKLGVNLFQEICNIVSVQIKGYCGILMGQVVACAG